MYRSIDNFNNISNAVFYRKTIAAIVKIITILKRLVLINVNIYHLTPLNNMQLLFPAPFPIHDTVTTSTSLSPVTTIVATAVVIHVTNYSDILSRQHMHYALLPLDKQHDLREESTQRLKAMPHPGISKSTHLHHPLRLKNPTRNIEATRRLH